MIIFEVCNSSDRVNPSFLVADAEAIETMVNWWKSHLPDFDYNIKICNSHIVNALRVLVVRGIIPHDAFVFEFAGEQILCNKDGTLDKWPKGFCSQIDSDLRELINKKIGL